MASVITVCATCRLDREDEPPRTGVDGETFAALIESAAEKEPSVKTRRHNCLMGCAHGCNVALQGPGKIAYTLGNFSPTEEAAQAVVDYARMHAESASGQVPYREWPEAVKEHFITRHPPLPDTAPE